VIKINVDIKPGSEPENLDTKIPPCVCPSRGLLVV